MQFAEERESVATLMRRVYDRGLTTTLGGNISQRVNDDIIAITPSGVDKGTIKGEQIGLVTLEGENLTPELKTSIETELHLGVYRARPDIMHALHAHPPISSCFTASEHKIDCTLLIESRAMLGDVVEVGYAMMGSEELARLVAEGAKNGNCLLIANHGVLTMGSQQAKTLERLEALESAAYRTIIMEIIGKARPIAEKELQAIDAFMSQK
ncbi:MAG: class II aldolase/adducin family protein [Candidatus Sumerlaeota bacterium]